MRTAPKPLRRRLRPTEPDGSAAPARPRSRPSAPGASARRPPVLARRHPGGPVRPIGPRRLPGPGPAGGGADPAHARPGGPQVMVLPLGERTEDHPDGLTHNDRTQRSAQPRATAGHSALPRRAGAGGPGSRAGGAADRRGTSSRHPEHPARRPRWSVGIAGVLHDQACSNGIRPWCEGRARNAYALFPRSSLVRPVGIFPCRPARGGGGAGGVAGSGSVSATGRAVVVLWRDVDCGPPPGGRGT